MKKKTNKNGKLCFRQYAETCWLVISMCLDINRQSVRITKGTIYLQEFLLILTFHLYLHALDTASVTALWT